MSDDGRTLPPPGRRAPPRPRPATELPIAEPRPRQDTLRGVGDDEPTESIGEGIGRRQRERLQGRSVSPVPSSLPPASDNPRDAQVLAQHRRIEQLEQARVIERRDLELKLAVAQAELAKAQAEKAPEKFMGMTMRQAMIGLVLAVTGAIAASTTVIGTLASSAKSSADRQEKRVDETNKTTETVRVKTRDNSGDIDKLRKELTDFKLHYVALWSKQGVYVRKPDGTELPVLDVEVPIRKAGQIEPGPSMIVKTPP